MAEAIAIANDPDSEALNEERNGEVQSLLDVLRAPRSSDLARKRKIATNQGGNRRGSKGVKQTDYEPKISAKQRVEEFEGENFLVRGNGIYCDACKEVLSVKKSNLTAHAKSKKHELNKEKLKSLGKREDDIAQALHNYDQEHHPKGETLPTSTRVFRIKVVQAFLKSGTPLNRLEFFREIFEEAGMSLSSSSNMRQLIPFVLEEEYKCLEREIKGKDISIIFDGTTRDGEALVVLVRFVNDWEVQSRLVRFQLTQNSVNGDELARIIIEVLHRKLDVLQSQLLAAMRDRAPVNTKALRTVSILYPSMLDVGCISHFLDRVGVKSVTPALTPFMSSWNIIFTTSMKGRRVWKNLTGKIMPCYNSIRWWSLWECAKVVFEEWAHIPAFLSHDEEFAKASRQKLSEALRQNPVKLRVEFAALVELERFVQATYTLEGDGALVLIAFEKLEELGAFIHVQNFPTITNTLQEMFPLNVADQRRWYQYAVGECLVPAFAYYSQTLVNDPVVARSVRVFKAARLFNPKYVKVSRPNAADIDQLGEIPFVDNNQIQSLRRELPMYLVKAADIHDDFDPLVDMWPWWKVQDQELLAWSAAVQRIVLIQPSSAAAERVFSLLATMFGDQQHDALEDYIEAALMLRVNNR
ncbi:hypothetical protein QZH41_007564 [Actinostola sp. cb2023]|nr:hypothetical protein QZH41_007564 [Actinostola sp. cb2023]